MAHRSLSFAALRACFGAACIALFLAGCGGGGGSAGVTGGSGGTGGGTGGGGVQPSLPPLQGTWQLTITPSSGVTTAAVSVPASEVPTSSQLDTTAVARLLARTRFQAYSTTVNGSSLRVTDEDTDYLMVINSVASADFDGCGTCAVGTDINFTLDVNFTESVVFDGVTIPSRVSSVELRVNYLRRS